VVDWVGFAQHHCYSFWMDSFSVRCLGDGLFHTQALITSVPFGPSTSWVFLSLLLGHSCKQGAHFRRQTLQDRPVQCGLGVQGDLGLLCSDRERRMI
jgi:hypothetical protein